MKRIYLLSTEHLEDGLWFREEDDFKVAMNYVAIEAARHPEVVVLSFELMSNHVHFVLKGREEDVEEYINAFKHRYSGYYQRKYGVKEFLRRNHVDIKELPYSNEAVERAIAYVLMNCVPAGICSHPSLYPWGTGSILFNQTKMEGIRVGNCSGRALERILHTNYINIPKNWIIGKEGYILTQNYVDVAAVERLYRTPQRLNYFFRSSSKAQKRLEADENLPAFKDQTILAALPDLCKSLFQKDSFSQLQPEEQSELARQIRFRFSADATQVARVCGVSYEQAAGLLDRV